MKPRKLCKYAKFPSEVWTVSYTHLTLPTIA